MTESGERTQHLAHLRRLALAGFEKHASDIVAIDVSQVTSIADSFLIMTGTSTRQVAAIAEGIEGVLREESESPLGVEGYREGRWLLFDLNDVIVHIFIPEMRTLYDLERLWHDAPRIELGLPQQENQRQG